MASFFCPISTCFKRKLEGFAFCPFHIPQPPNVPQPANAPNPPLTPVFAALVGLPPADRFVPPPQWCPFAEANYIAVSL